MENDKNLYAFSRAKSEFASALCASGCSVHAFDIEFDSTLIDEDGYYSFLISVQLRKHETDDGTVEPKPVIFQIDFHIDYDQLYFIVGEDTEMNITYGNVFSYMYFSTLEAK